MENESFDGRIKSLKEMKLISCHKSLENNVLRRVRLKSSEESVWEWLGSLVPRTSFSIPALAIVILTGVAVPAVAENYIVSHSQDGVDRIIRQIMGFDVFESAEILNFDSRK